MKWLIATGVIYIAGAVVSYGATLHYFSERFKCFAYPARRRHQAAAIAAAALGPFGLLHRCMYNHFDRRNNESLTGWGLRFHAAGYEESWNDYQRRWPNLTKQDWLKS